MLEPVITIETAASSAVIDSTLLFAGHTYMFELATMTGWPKVNDGDFATIVLPIQQAISWSHPFVPS